MRQAYDYWQDQPGNRPLDDHAESAWRRCRMTVPAVLRSRSDHKGLTQRNGKPVTFVRSVSTCKLQAGTSRSNCLMFSRAGARIRRLSRSHDCALHFLRSGEGRLVHPPRSVSNKCRLLLKVRCTRRPTPRLCFLRVPCGYWLRLHNIRHYTPCRSSDIPHELSCGVAVRRGQQV